MTNYYIGHLLYIHNQLTKQNRHQYGLIGETFFQKFELFKTSTFNTNMYILNT